MRTLLDDTDNLLGIDDLADFMSGRLRVVESTTAEHRFLHWPLVFADVLSEQSGFDLLVGNPPWVPLHWTEKEVLAQYDPATVLRKWSADRIARQRTRILGDANLARFIDDARTGAARAAFARHPHNFPLLQGTAPNTYKLFLAQAFALIARNGTAGLVHPVDHFLDPRGGLLREACHRRLALLLQFANARTAYMFSDVAHRTVFSICTYRGVPSSARFCTMANLFAPETVDESLEHDGAGPVPGIKDTHGDWQLRGHRSRVIEVDEKALANLGSILDPGRSPGTCRLPMLHSRELAASLVKIASQPRRLDDLKGEYLQDSMWHETADRKAEPPVFKRETAFRERPEDVILTGPIMGLANPLAKSPNRHCRTHQDYEEIDLTLIPDNYLPRSNYVPALPWSKYRDLVRSVPWNRTGKQIDYPRIVLRRRGGTASERTLQCCLVGDALAHVNVCESVAFRDHTHLIEVCTLWNSLPYDFITKSFQVTDVFASFTSQLPLVELPATAYHRMLQLNCLTTHHADSWNKLASNYTQLGWSATHPGLELEDPLMATDTWTRNCALRTDLSRRQALLEVDVLVAIALGLTLDELIQIYRLVFPVLNSYEDNTWYDRNGRIVWSKRSGKGMNMPRAEWERHRNMQRGPLAEDVIIDFLPNGPYEYTIEYEPPFTKPDREVDYRLAWGYFEKHMDIPIPSN